MDGPGHDPHALRRRHPGRPVPQPIAGGLLHAHPRPSRRDALESLRREGPVDQQHRIGRPGDYLRAETALPRAVRRRGGARAAVARPAVGRGAGRTLPRVAGQGGDRAARRGNHDCRLGNDGPCGPRGDRGSRHRRRDHRPTNARALGLGVDRRVRGKDRPLRRGARSAADRWLRRGNCRAVATTLLLPSGSAD